MNCSKCSYANPPDFSFCTNCGSHLESDVSEKRPLLCSKCDYVNSPNSQFCAICGTVLSSRVPKKHSWKAFVIGNFIVAPILLVGFALLILLILSPVIFVCTMASQDHQGKFPWQDEYYVPAKRPSEIKTEKATDRMVEGYRNCQKQTSTLGWGPFLGFVNKDKAAQCFVENHSHLAEGFTPSAIMNLEFSKKSLLISEEDERDMKHLLRPFASK